TIWCDHHRDPRRAALLFRGRLPPAISGKESARLLRSRRHRCELSGRSFRSGVSGFVVPLEAAEAAGAERIGPEAANLAALTRAGLPTPGGFALTADAYRAQIAALSLAPLLKRFAHADTREQRQLAVDIRLALYEQPIVSEIATPLLAAWRAQRKEST